MANEIHNYPLQIYALGDLDFMDVDFFNGVAYDSAKILGRDIKAGKYCMITDSSLVTGLGEQTIIDGTALGSLSIPANGFQVGDSFRLTMRGIIGAHNNDTITIRIKSGTLVLASSGAITLPAITDKPFTIDVDFTVRAIGGPAVASLVSAGGFTYNKNASNNYEGQDFISIANTFFDTTIINTLDVTAQFSSAHVDNHIQAKVAILEKTY
jgi:hypothetical protein